MDDEAKERPDPEDDANATDIDDGDPGENGNVANLVDKTDPPEVIATTSRKAAARSSATPVIVKVAVTVNGKSQLLELDQSLKTNDVCRALCEEHSITWKPRRYALALSSARQSVPFVSHKYLTEANRRDLRHGAELVLTYAPDVFAGLIAERLQARANRSEWVWALTMLAEYSGDSAFVGVFAGIPGAVGLVLDDFLQDQKVQRLRHKELLCLLRILLCFVRQGVKLDAESSLPRLVRGLAAMVRSEQNVDEAVMEATLRILAAVSAQPWAVSAADHLGVVDLVPLLWDTERPAVQTSALELMNAMATREIRLGPDSPAGKMQMVKAVTSPQVCSTITQYVLGATVRSTMARQLFLLQQLLLRPLKEAIETPATSPVNQIRVRPPPAGPPPRLPRRKSRAILMSHSRSWCGGDEGLDGVDRATARDRRSMEGPPAGSTSPTVASDLRDLSLRDLRGLRDSRGSVTSLASTTSTASASDSISGNRRSDMTELWTEFLDDRQFSLSQLSEECLQYLCSHHPTLAARAEEEEEAMHGSLSMTAERLVRLLGAELSLCPGQQGGGGRDRRDSAISPWLYQPLVFMREVSFFHELFCRGLNLLAKTRREMRAKTPRDQDKVLRVVRRQFREALGAQVVSWDQLDRWLSELPYSAVAALWEKERLSVERDTTLSSPAVQELRANYKQSLRHLVREQRLCTLRTGARFRRPVSSARPPLKSKRSYVWVSLADSSLQYAECTDEEGGEDSSRLLGAPLSLPLASVTSVVTGRKCAHIWGSRSRKQGIDLAISLLLDPHDCDSTSLDLIAPDVSTLEVWADGLNMLLGKECASRAVERDMNVLMDMEVRLQLMELEGVVVPTEPPPVPPAPPDFNFVTP